MADATHLNLRTARHVLAKAVAAGNLEVERRGTGRGKPAVYRLTLPPGRLRHDHIPRAQPEKSTGPAA